MRRVLSALGVLAALIGAVVPASAQTLPTSIAGTVKDVTGGVMPGVTVEASSPALIEKVRTAVTDEHGEYKIIDLRPGTYSVTFTLTGFNVTKRDGIELQSGFAAKIDAELRVGALEETLTVSGQAPVVDVQNTSQIKTVSAEMLFALPITKEMGGLAKVTVGVMIPPTAQDVGGNIDPMNAYPVIHGGRTNDNRALLDGMQFNGEGQGRGFYFNPAAAQEASVQLGGQTAEFENGGFQANMIPKDGGNLFSGIFSSNYAGKGLVSDNLTQELRDRGLTQVNKAQRTYDANIAFGGPIARDKLWFFTAHRVFGYQNLLAGNYYNLTPGTMFYTPADGIGGRTLKPALHQQDNYTDGIRLTYQLSSKDKIAVGWDLQHSVICLYCSPLRSPEATPRTTYANPNYLLQGKWSRVITPKLFLEVADSTLIFNWPNQRKDGGDGISILNASTGYRYGAPQASELGQRVASQSNQRASLSYVTGSHAFKFGFTTQEAFHHAWYDNGGPGKGLGNGLTSYTFLGTTPNSITQYAEPVLFDERLKVNFGGYVQDQWTLKKITLNLGIRYDYFNAYVPEQNLSAGPFVPARNYDKVNCVPCWKDINPRAAVAYDIFGNGKSALKFNVGRYVMADIYTMARANNPVTRAVLNATRTWTDSNGNYVPDCDLTNFGAQNNSASGGDVCGALNNVNFGRNNPNAVTFADDTRLGFGSRPYNWQTQITFDQQLRHNVSLGIGYFRTSWGGFNANQNVALASGTGDFSPFCVTTPADSRLPGGGNQQVCGLYDVNPAKFGQSTIVTQKAATEKGNVSEIYNGFDVVLNIRLPRRININGGFNTGRTVTDNCGLTLNNLQYGLANVPHTEEYCHVTPPWSASTQMKFSGAFPLPYAFQTAVTFQDLPGIPWSNWSNTATNLSTAGLAVRNYTSAEIAQSLGRPLAAGANAVVQVPIIAPATKYEGRIRQLDFRFSRLFKVRNTRLEPQFDIYNALNASPVLALNTTFGAAFLRPTQILGGRTMKFGVQVTF